MRRMLSGVAVLMLGTAVGSTLDAQACMGLNSPTNLQFGAEVGNDAKAFGVNVNFGKATGVFFGVGGTYTSLDHDLGNIKGVAGTIGWSVGAGSEKKLAVCPNASLGYSSGPNDILGTGIDLSTISATGGLSVGLPVAAGSDFTLIPTASFDLVYASVKAKNATSSETESDAFGLLSGGVGFLISPRFLIKPFISIPVALDNSDPSFGIILSIGLGKGGS